MVARQQSSLNFADFNLYTLHKENEASINVL